MKTYLSFILSICCWFTLFAQHSLSGFDNLVNKTWKTETQWDSNHPFFQEITFEYALDSTIILTKTKGYIDEEQTKIGDRNFGIRQYDKAKQAIYFVEFDTFGGKTEGSVHIENNNLTYTYIYGDVELTEKWIYVNPTTYGYTIGIWKNDKWDTIYLESQFIQTN